MVFEKNKLRSKPAIITALLLLISAFCLSSCAAKREPLSAMDYVNALIAAKFPVDNPVEKPADSEYFKYSERVMFADYRLTQYNAEYPMGGEIQIYETKELMQESLKNHEAMYINMPDLTMHIFPAPDELAIFLFEEDLHKSEAQKYVDALNEFCKKGKITKNYE